MFSKWLAKELKERNLSQKQFGDMIGVSQGCVGLWLNGKTTPKFDLLQSCADALGYKVVLVKKADN